MRSEVFVYLDIYSVYLQIYDYGVFIQGVRFPDGVTPGPARSQTGRPSPEPESLSHGECQAGKGTMRRRLEISEKGALCIKVAHESRIDSQTMKPDDFF